MSTKMYSVAALMHKQPKPKKTSISVELTSTIKLVNEFVRSSNVAVATNEVIARLHKKYNGYILMTILAKEIPGSKRN